MAKVNISLHSGLWKAFRIACLSHDTSASHEIARLIAHQLAAWATTLPAATPDEPSPEAGAQKKAGRDLDRPA